MPVKSISKAIDEFKAEVDRRSHPAARLFPMLQGHEWDRFLVDFEKRGQQQPIVVDPDGLVLDGRNRLLACLVLNRAPVIETRQLSGSAAVAFVISGNLHRRHQDAGARAIQMAELQEMLKSAGVAPLSQVAAAQAAGVSDRQYRAGERLREDDAELAEEVKKGHITLNAARSVAKMPQAPDRQEVLKKVQQAGNKKKSKAIVKKATPLEMPGLHGTYSTLLAIVRNIPELPHNLRTLHKLTNVHRLSPSGAIQIKDALLKVRKFNFDDLVAAIDVAITELDEIISTSAMEVATSTDKEPAAAE